MDERAGNRQFVPGSGERSGAFRKFLETNRFSWRKAAGAPVWVGKERLASGKAALETGGVDIFVLDDGFSILRSNGDLDIVLLDCRSPFGNGFLLPGASARTGFQPKAERNALILTRADGGPQRRRLSRDLGKGFLGQACFCVPPQA